MMTRLPLLRQIGILEMVLTLLLALGLLAPFVTPPWEHETRIAVRFRTTDMTHSSGFTVRTSSTICYVLSALLSYRDPTGNGFVQIDCGKRAVAPAQEIRAERAAALHTDPAAAALPR